MTAAQIAKQIIFLGESFAERRGLRRADGIAAMVEAVALCQVEMFVEQGEVFMRLPDQHNGAER